jgi:hemerythrin-like domain-containing protein
MQPLINSLHAEHRDLRRALEVLRAMRHHVASGLPFPDRDCAALLRYLREFVVGVHFVKEAWILRALAIFGRPGEVRAAGEVLRSQEVTRDLLHALVLFWEPTETLTPAERRGFVRIAGAVDRGLVRGMLIEERQVFPALGLIPLEDRPGWSESTAAIETWRRAAADWRSELAELKQRWT